MIIQDSFAKCALTLPLSYQQIDRDGHIADKTQPVLTEHTIHVQIEEGPELRFVCMACHIPELIAGHLLTEGYIQRSDEILRITIDESGNHGTVKLSAPPPPDRFPLRSFPKMCWELPPVFMLADAFAGEMPLHNMTYAAHSCFLAHKGEILFACEDIGRHNALDKAVGYAMIHKLVPEECLLYSSGRMPIDMVSKAIRSGFPVLISKGSPTAGAVAMARKHGLTLICSARKDSIKVFSDGSK